MSKILFSFAIVLMSLLTGLLLAIILTIILKAVQVSIDLNMSSSAEAIVFVSLFAVSWLGFGYLLQLRTQSTSHAFASGFLLLALLWLIYLGTYIFAAFVGQVLPQRNESGFWQAVSLLFAGTAIMINVGFSVCMALASMMGYALSVLLPREFSNELDNSNVGTRPAWHFQKLQK